MKKVIILHGWTKDLKKWEEFLKFLSKKGVDYRFPKIPGLTGNDLPKVWDLSDYVEWLKNIVDKEKESIILVGHSNGGRIALSFTNLFPEKVEKLILIDSSGIYHNELNIRIKRIVFKAIAKVGKKITSSKILKELMYKTIREHDYENTEGNLRQTMINLVTSDLKPILPNIKKPTLIIWGEKDKTTPLSDGEIMNKNIKNSKLIVIDDAKHAPQFTNPEKIAKIIYEYI